MRLDTTLVDVSDMRWVRGDITFLYNGDTSPEAALAVLDNQVILSFFPLKKLGGDCFPYRISIIISVFIVPDDPGENICRQRQTKHS